MNSQNLLRNLGTLTLRVTKKHSKFDLMSAIENCRLSDFNYTNQIQATGDVEQSVISDRKKAYEFLKQNVTWFSFKTSEEIKEELLKLNDSMLFKNEFDDHGWTSSIDVVINENKHESIFSVNVIAVNKTESSKKETEEEIKLEPFTLRFRANKAVTLSDFGSKAVTLHTIDDMLHIYDVYYNNANWSAMFAGASWLINVLDANLDGVTNVGGFFNGAINLETLKISSAANITSLGGFFGGNSKLVSATIKGTLSVTDFSNLFNAGLNALQYAFIECGSVCTSLSQTFMYCSALKKVIISGDTSNVTSISSTFSGCVSLKSVPTLDTSSVTSMNDTLYNCRKVESGALTLYQQASTQANPPSYHSETFKNCGADTASGLAELQQIPTSWGGLLVTNDYTPSEEDEESVQEEQSVDGNN